MAPPISEGPFEDVSTGGSKIVGGVEATAGDWPGMVSLQSGGHFCGGTLIGADVVLTAAHCVEGSSPRGMSAVVGRHDLSSGVGERISVREIITHERYNGFSNDSDIAIVLLSAAATAEPFPAIDADTVELTAAGSDATALGWGATRQGAFTTPDRLRLVTLPIVSTAVANERIAYDGQITARMMAAGNAAGGKDTCQGDSGGPLFVHDEEGQAYVAGITSWGFGCAQPNKYGIYTRVSEFTDWIKENSGIFPEGRISFSSSRYSAGQTAQVTLTDSDLVGAGVATVELRSTRGDVEQVELTESHPGRFAGQIELVDQAVAISNQRLEVAAPDTIEVVYRDADVGDGSSIETIAVARLVADDVPSGPTTQTEIRIGEDFAGEIELSGDEDWFRFQASAGKAYQFDVVLDGSLDDSVLQLFDEAGVEEIDSNDDSGNGFASRLRWEPSDDEVVNLVVSGYSQTVGTYELQVAEYVPMPDDHGNDAASATDVAIDQPVEGQIGERGDVDWFALPVEAGTDYLITTELGSLSDTVLRVIADDGLTEVAYNDDFGDSFASRVTWNAGFSGIAYLEVAGFGESSDGTYTMLAAVNPNIVDDHGNRPAVAKNIDVPTRIDASIDYAADVDVFAFAATAGSTYQFATELGELSDSVLRVLDADSTELAQNDDAGLDTFASRLDWVAPATGTYYVEVSGFESSEGSYQLLTSEPLRDDHGDAIESATDISNLPATVLGSFEMTNDRDWFSFEANQGIVYRIDTKLVSVEDTVLRLWNADGTDRLAINDDNGTTASTIIWEATEDGPLFVEVEGFGAQIGDYELSVRVPYGDANLDGVFSSADLVAVFQAGGYEDDEPNNATWSIGDWNGDGEFTSADLVAAFAGSEYEE